MSYIDKNLVADEFIKFRTKKHYVIFAVPFVLILICLFFSISNPLTDALDKVFNGTHLEKNLNRTMALLFLAGAALIAFREFLLYSTSEFAVTNKRVLMKEGFFQRSISDTRLSTISHVTVEQSLLGQILNYGTIIIKGFGGSSDIFVQVAKPNVFQQSVHKQLDQMGR